MAVPLQYWKTDPHKWGAGGVIHVIHEDGTKTLCGKPLSQCPGRHVPADEYTCKGCASVMVARELREKREQEWRKNQREREAQQAEQQRVWRLRYEAYLRSPEWAKKRDKVLERVKRICEACGERRATQVHHLTYAHLGDEPLFDLRAVCKECHEKITEMDRERRIPFYQGVMQEVDEEEVSWGN